MKGGVQIIHELAVTEGILKVALKNAESNRAHRIVSISLKVGELRDLVDEWVQRYFDYVSRDTIAEGAIIKIQRVPVVVQCQKCGCAYEVNIRQLQEISCLQCGGTRASLIAGQEMSVEEIEVI